LKALKIWVSSSTKGSACNEGSGAFGRWSSPIFFITLFAAWNWDGTGANDGVSLKVNAICPFITASTALCKTLNSRRRARLSEVTIRVPSLMSCSGSLPKTFDKTAF
jgi:hypothetical protein